MYEFLTIDLPRLNSSFTKFVSAGFYVLGTWSIISFPLPNILLSFQYLNNASLERKIVYNDYMTANVSNNFYNVMSPLFIYVNEAYDDTLTVQWRFPLEQLFSMQLIAISYDYSSQKAHYHQLYNHSGMSLFYQLKYLIFFILKVKHM